MASKGKPKGAGSQGSDLRNKLMKSLSMSLNFGGREDFSSLNPVANLLRVLSWDSGVAGDLKAWAATRGVPTDDPDIGEDLRVKLALNLFNERKQGTILDINFSLGTALHLMRGPKLPFPPGTLFEQREVVPGEAGSSPRTDRISDSSSGWQHLAEGIRDGELLHVANIHRDALLPPSQAGGKGGYLSNLSEGRLTLDEMGDLATPGSFDIGASAIVASLDEKGARKTYWADPSHTVEYKQAMEAKKFYSLMHVATFREYCDFLWDAAKVIWAMGRGEATPTDLDKFKDAAQKFPDKKLSLEDRGEIYAGMQTLAQYLRASGATSNAPYFAAAGRYTPGQQNLLDIAYYWVTHSSDVTDTSDPVGRNRDEIMARYINACYDFLQWAGAAGLFAFFKVGTLDEVPIIGDPSNKALKGAVMADLGAIADAEGMDIDKLKSEQTELEKNPRTYSRTPWSTLSHAAGLRVGSDTEVNTIERNILYHRLEKVFNLLRSEDWEGFTDKSVGTFVRKVTEYVGKDKKNLSRKKSGFAWFRMDLVKAKSLVTAGVRPEDPTKKSRKKKDARDYKIKESYPDSFSRLSYRYIVNYVGGQLHFFRDYVEKALHEKADFWMKYCKKLVPLDRWRLYIEVAYMVTLLTQRTAPKEEARSMSKVIKEVIPVVMGSNFFKDLAKQAKSVKVDPKLNKDGVVKEIQELIKKGDWVEFIDRLYKRLIRDRARKRGSAKAETTEDPAKETPRQVYFRNLEKATMQSIQSRLGIVLLLRHFYRSLYFFLPPEVPDYMPPMFLDQALDDKSFAMLLDQEAIAQQYLGRRPTGGKFRIRVAVPVEVAAELSRIVIDPETGTLAADLEKPIEVSRDALLQQLTPKSKDGADLPDHKYRIILRFYREDGTETCFAINEHVWHAAQHELNRRLCNYIHNCQVLAARMAQTMAKPTLGDRGLDKIAEVAFQQANVIAAGATRGVAIASALLTHLPESFPALACFAFSGRLPRGCVTALKEIEQTALKDTTGFEIKSMTRHLRNLSDAPDGKENPNSYYTFKGTFSHTLGQNLNRRLLGPRLDHARWLAVKKYKGGNKTKEKQRMRDILDWALAKRLILHFRQGDDIKGLPTFADMWGQADPLKIAMDLAKDAISQIDAFTKNYPNFEAYPPFPHGSAPVTTQDVLNATPKDQAGEGGAEGRPEGDADGTKQEKTISQDAVLLAVMKALVLTSEQDPNDKALSYQLSKNVRAKLLQMIYAHEFLLGQITDDAKALLRENDLLPGGLRCLINAPALIPSIGFAKTLGWVVSDIVRNSLVVEGSIQQPLPPKVDGKDALIDKETKTPLTLEQAESRQLDSFTSPRKNYADAVQEVLGVLAAAQALGAKESHWKRFVTLVDKEWVARVKQIATSDKLIPASGNLFNDLLEPARAKFNAFAKVMRKRLKKIREHTARSLDPTMDEKLKPLPLPLSSTTPTIGKIQDFSTIEGHLRANVVVPIKDVLQELKVDGGKRWQVEVNGKQTPLTGGFRPGSIPFIIYGSPLVDKQVRNQDAFFGGQDQNPLRPEVGVPGHRVGERDTRADKLDGWNEIYTTNAEEAGKVVNNTLTTMHQLRAYKLGIEQRLQSRSDTVAELARLRHTAPQIAKKLVARDMMVVTGGSSVGLTPDEEKAVEGFLKSWQPHCADGPDLVKELAGSILRDEPTSPGKRIDAYLGESGTAKKRAKALARLLGGVPITTWGNGEFAKAAARGEKLAGIIGSHLSRLGFRVRDQRALRDFYLASSERIDRAKEDEVRLGQEQANLVAKAFTSALDRLRQPGVFLAFRDGSVLPCEVPLARGLPEVSQEEKKKTSIYTCRGRLLGKIINKATIDGVQIQVPLYPSGTVAANVFVKGPMPVAHSPTNLAKWQQETSMRSLDKTPAKDGGKAPVKDLVKNLVFSLDINRLPCPRTIAPGLVAIAGEEGKEYPEDPDEKIEDWDLPFEHWARLAGVYDYINDRPNQFVGREKRAKGGTKVVYPAAAFYRRTLAEAFAPPGKAIKLGKPDPAATGKPAPSVGTTTQPAETAPYDIEAVRVELNFRDLLGALMKTRGTKHSHLQRKKPAIIRRMKQLKGKGKKGPFLRARTALYFVNRAGNHVRDADLTYLFHVIDYCEACSNAAFIAHESLDFGSTGDGGPGGVVVAMMKDFKPAKNFLLRQFKALGRVPKNIPKMDGVSPAYTSQRCNYCARLDVKGTLDDSASADHAPCDKCGHIYDRHGSASNNIGDRFIRTRLAKKKTRRKKGDAKEGQG